MTERPILFQGAMVRALLAGTKTQTRRPLYVLTKNIGTACFDNRYPPTYGFDGEWPTMPVGHGWTLSQWRKAKAGDRLWVREAWAPNGPLPDDGALYRADFPEGKLTIKFKPSIHMPRWASRIALEVTSVRVERLQAISEADARAEGAPDYEEGIDAPPPDGDHEWSYRASFQRLWESINGPGSWDVNPWVWAVEFRRIQ